MILVVTFFKDFAKKGFQIMRKWLVHHSLRNSHRFLSKYLALCPAAFDLAFVCEDHVCLKVYLEVSSSPGISSHCLAGWFVQKIRLPPFYLFCENCNPVRAQHGLQVPKKAQKKGPTLEFLNTQCNPETITCMITEYGTNWKAALLWLFDCSRIYGISKTNN